MKNDYQRILIIAPHQDDEVIGCGGFICYAKDKNYTVYVQHVFSGNSGISNSISEKETTLIRNEEAYNAAKLEDVILLNNYMFEDRSQYDGSKMQKCIIETIRSISPTIVFLPHANESDYEHRLVSEFGKEACWLSAAEVFPRLGEKMGKIPTILYYEVWKNIETPKMYLTINKFVERKRNMLLEYTSQMQNTAWVSGTLGRNEYRGTTIRGGGYIEVFDVECLNMKDML